MSDVVRRRPVGNGPGWGGPARGSFHERANRITHPIWWYQWCSPESRMTRLKRIEDMLAVLEHYAEHGETPQLRVLAAERAAQRLMDADRHALILHRMGAHLDESEPPNITITIRDSDS